MARPPDYAPASAIQARYAMPRNESSGGSHMRRDCAVRERDRISRQLFGQFIDKYVAVIPIVDHKHVL